MEIKQLFSVLLAFCLVRTATGETRLYLAAELFGIANPAIQIVSADGSTFAGYDDPKPGTAFGRGFRWSWSEGHTTLELPGSDFSSMLSISPDGSSLVGRSFSEDCVDNFRWTKQAGVQRLNLESCNAEPGSNFHDASPDGNILVGGFHIKRSPWDRYANTYRVGENGYQETRLGVSSSSDALEVSADGRVVYGDDFVNSTIFRWTEENGVTRLGTLPGYEQSYMDSGPKERVSADGSVVVGVAVDDDGKRQAIRWTEETGMVGLGFLSGHTSTFPWAVSADGQVVLGYAFTAFSPERGSTAFVWDAVHGMRSLPDVLAAEFQLADALDLRSARGISADRQTIFGSSFSQDETSWIVRLDRPLVAFGFSGVFGDMTNDHRVTVADVDVLMSAIRDGSSETPYDLDGSGSVEAGDLAHLLHDTLQTWFGDANLDGQFSSPDLVAVFQAGQYEDAIENNSTWSNGDWNSDNDFTTSDLVVAFQDGGYEAGPRPTVQAVPEPTGGVLLAMGLLVSCRWLRRR